MEDPPDVGVPETPEDADDPPASVVRRVWVVGGVAVLVMPAMNRDPLQHRPLDCHRTEGGQNESDNGVGLETAVREQPVKADRNPEGGEDVHAQ